MLNYFTIIRLIYDELAPPFSCQSDSYLESFRQIAKKIIFFAKIIVVQAAAILPKPTKPI
ncbi:hypothetical protein LPB140_12075 [Sphingorhabdus lutea]|uniref:Uncharacterized protein n=1 Tax=Sphingorhabdus lutea TaxID=1913578 RepID=A0A1L3J8P4_9SPHN|nr:hypothetical protein LPB140_00030 [Sphingorhabdus lutea]APG63400.1 hypothetical protein LPB140_12075 [Sphingorhabdus lutea]